MLSKFNKNLESKLITSLITARKRSLRRLCFYICLSVILFTGGGYLGRCTPPGRYTPPSGAVHAGRYGQQAGGRHPTGMHSCLVKTITAAHHILALIDMMNHKFGIMWHAPVLKLGEGNVFTGMSVHTRGYALFQVPSGWYAWSLPIPPPLDMGPGIGTPPPPPNTYWQQPHVRSASGRYASYWNAFLLV